MHVVDIVKAVAAYTEYGSGRRADNAKEKSTYLKEESCTLVAFIFHAATIRVRKVSLSTASGLIKIAGYSL